MKRFSKEEKSEKLDRKDPEVGRKFRALKKAGEPKKGKGKKAY